MLSLPAVSRRSEALSVGETGSVGQAFLPVSGAKPPLLVRP